MTLDIAAIKARADKANGAFITCVAGDGKPYVKFQFRDLKAAQDFHGAVIDARTDIPDLLAALEASQAILESDRTRIIDGVNGLSDALRRRQWLLTSRGSYEWDDARFTQEFRDAIDEIDKAVEPLRSIGADKSNCPQTTAEVIQARVDLIAALEASEAARVKAEQERDALKEAQNVTDELMASQYRAGAQAGWNAAQLIWPKSQEAIARLTNVEKGDLEHIRAANARRALDGQNV